MSRKPNDDLSLGGEFPIVPPDPLHPEPGEISPPGSGWGTIAILIAVSILVIGFAGVMVMFSTHAGGGR
jgi:hypothetical protein